MNFFTSEARKAQIAALIGFLAPILFYIQAENEWSWRAFFAAVLSGVITGAGVYATPNARSTQENS